MMRPFSFVVAATLMTGSCAPPPPQLARAADVDLDAVARFSAEVDRCVAEKDLEGFAALWLDDITLLNPDHPAVVGRSAVLDVYRAMFAALDYAGRHKPVETYSIGDLVVHQGVVTGTMTPTAGGSPMHLNNKFLWLLRRQIDGSLLAWRVMLNSNAPAVPPGEGDAGT
jgi:ketosteroid isomerase-like protein